MAAPSRVNPGTPKAVAKAAKNAEKLHKEIYGDPEAEAQEKPTKDGAQDAKAESDGGDIQPVEPEAKPEADPDTPPPSPEGAAEVKPVEPPKDDKEAKPEAASKEEDWEAKYKALQGKYNAEVPRLSAELREMREVMRHLQQAQQAAQQPQAKAAEPAAEEKPVVSDRDIEDYGEDLIDLIRRVARGEVSTVEKTLKPEIEAVKGQVVSSVKKQATNTVYSVLDREVQDWRNINKSAEFLEWLNTSDPYAGDIRKNLLSDAFQKGDGDRVAAFFKGFLAERQVVSPAPQPQPETPAAEPEVKPQVSLEQLAGPKSGAVQGGQAPQERQPEVWSRADIAKFYSDVANGVFAKNPQRKAQIENSIASAMKEGRIR